MQHDPFVCIEDAIQACELILKFTVNMKDSDFYFDLLSKIIL